MENELKCGMSIKNQPRYTMFDTCVQANHAKSSCKRETGRPFTREDNPYLYMRSNERKKTNGGLRYFPDRTTTPHCFIQAQVMKHINESMEHIFVYITWIDKKVERAIRRVYTDNAKEILLMGLRLRKTKIRVATSCKYSTQSNGLTVRANCTTFNNALETLKNSRLETTFWGDATKHTAYLYFQMAPKALKSMALFEKLLRRTSHTSSLRIFACPAYVQKLKRTRKLKFWRLCNEGNLRRGHQRAVPLLRTY